MKNKLMKNLSLKILSVVAAFLFWLVIINVTDPTTVKTFYGIPVQVLNENVNTVKSRLYRGLKKLRLELTDAWQWE